LGSVASLLLAVAAIGGVAIYWSRAQRQRALEGAARSAFLPLDYAKEIATLRANVAREPCDRSAIIRLGEALMSVGDARGTVERTSAFFRTCGEFPRLRWLSYAAHKQLSEWDQAAAEATRLIESDPYDADYRGWRGVAYEQKGDFSRAAEDYQQALVLRPGLVDLPINLANTYEKLGRPCDAVLPLAQAVFQHPHAPNAAGVHARIAQLASSPACAWTVGEGHAKVKTKPGAGVVVVKVLINSRVTGEFIVDTGATLVVLSRAFAERAGISTRGAPSLLAQTANGVTSGALVALDRVDLQGVHAARVPATVVDNLGGVDGLLGMSFLARFDLRHSEGLLELSARKP
jgi:aspartyl protease family protein